MDDVEGFNDLPFDIVQKLKDTVGLKRFKQMLKEQEELDKEGTAIIAKSAGKRKRQDVPANSGTQKLKAIRASKSSPLEITSKVQPKKLRKVFLSTKPRAKDPRFEEHAGHLNNDLFAKSYEFLDEKRAQEESQLRKELRKPHPREKKEQLTRLLQRLKDKKTEGARRLEQSKRKSERAKDEMELVKKGKKPFYLKKSVEKSLDLLDKFDSIKANGSVTKKLTSRRKRDASKAKKKLPRQL